MRMRATCGPPSPVSSRWPRPIPTIPSRRSARPCRPLLAPLPPRLSADSVALLGQTRKRDLFGHGVDLIALNPIALASEQVVKLVTRAPQKRGAILALPFAMQRDKYDWPT